MLSLMLNSVCFTMHKIRKHCLRFVHSGTTGQRGARAQCRAEAGDKAEDVSVAAVAPARMDVKELRSILERASCRYEQRNSC